MLETGLACDSPASKTCVILQEMSEAWNINVVLDLREIAAEVSELAVFGGVSFTTIRHVDVYC